MTVTGRLFADRRLRTRRAGRTFVGGVPLRIITVSERGKGIVREWLAGAAIGATDSEQRLARKLLEAGLVHPSPQQSLHRQISLTTVIPVKDDHHGLRTTVGRLEGPIIVVDDGSEPAVSRSLLETTHGAPVRVIRNGHTLGPAAARNAGAAACDSEIIAFVDAGLRITQADLRRLTPHFNDEQVVAAAPRVRSTEQAGFLARYERSFSPLDLGSDPGPVGPGRAITYAPSACLLVRVDALRDVGGFDPALRFGEDVDLIWRLAQIGTVRYDPEIVVEHDPRHTLRGWCAQRFNYGTSAAPLAKRHPDSVAPWRVSRWSVVAIALLSTGHPGLALAPAIAPLRGLRSQLANLPDANVEAIRLILEGHSWAGRSFAENAARTWSPIALILALSGFGRAPILRWMVLGWSRRIGRSRSPGQFGLGVLDDLSYGLGVVTGAARGRSIRSLVPRITR